MANATGINKKVIYKKEATFGVDPGPTGAQSLRRKSSDINLSKDTYQSEELRDDYQDADMRHGTRKVGGTINGELSPATYKDFMAAAVRSAFATGVSTSAQTTISAVAGVGFARSVGSFLTDGFKVGRVVRATGMTATGNNTKNFMVTAVAALTLNGFFLDGSLVLVSAAGASTTIAEVGKVASVPLTGHTDDSFTIEHQHADISVFERFNGCKVGSLAVKLPATGMSEIDIAIVGQNQADGNSVYFTTPTAQTTTPTLAAVNGAVIAGGVRIVTITGMEFTIDGDMSTEAVVGSNSTPDVFEGKVKVSGQLTALFTDATFRDAFRDETEMAIACAFTTSNQPAADFLAFAMTRVKLGGNGKSDGAKGIVQTVPFTALLDVNGGTALATPKTTITIQDSAA